MAVNVPALGEVANFGTDYFLSKIKFLAKCKREFTTKFAILPNACCAKIFYTSFIVNDILYVFAEILMLVSMAYFNV